MAVTIAPLTMGVLTSGDVAVIDAAVAGHTLVGCERIVVMEDGDRHLFFAQGWGRWVPEVPSGVQFMLYAPRGATRATAFLTTYATGNYTVYVRRDAPVHFSVSGWPDVVITVEEYDFEFPGSPERVSFTEWSIQSGMPSILLFVLIRLVALTL